MEFTTNLELQSQATRLIENKLDTHAIGMNGAITLHGTSFQKTLPIFRDNIISSDYNSYDFQSELFPLHSPLLRESWLVSFPPPSYMLKFSGYSWLIGGPIKINESLLRWLSTVVTRYDGISRPDSLH